jgi:hypothetical protein
MVWIVKAGDTCRTAEGFNESTVFMYVDTRGQILIFGEVSQDDNSLIEYEIPAPVHFYCCPPELREHCRPEDMKAILIQMGVREASWSWGTAVRAFLLSADVYDDADLENIKKCWNAAPICTSVVIIFWQRYMCKLADALPDGDAMDWILAWMPLMADRTLPGELLSTMQRCGWILIDSIEAGKRRSFSI